MARGGANGRSRKLRIFISYRRKDSVGHAGRLYDALASQFGVDAVFMDIDAIPLGVDFSVVLAEEVARCDVMIAVVGPQWLEITDESARRRIDSRHDYVRMELEAALDHGLRIIPVLVHGASMPRPDDLPHEIAAFSRRNALELSDQRWHAGVATLCRELTQPAAPPRPSRTRSARRRSEEPTPSRIEAAPGRTTTPYASRDPAATDPSLVAIASGPIVLERERTEAQNDELPPPPAGAIPGHNRRRSPRLNQLARVGVAAAVVLVVVPIALASRSGADCSRGAPLAIVGRGGLPEQLIIRAVDDARVEHAGIYVGDLFAAFPDDEEAYDMNDHVPITEPSTREISWPDFQRLERRPRDGFVAREWAPRAGKTEPRYYIAAGGAMFHVQEPDTLRTVGIKDLADVPVVPRKLFDRRDYAFPADGTLLSVAGSNTVYEVSRRVRRKVDACSDAHVVRMPPSSRILDQVPDV